MDTGLSERELMMALQDHLKEAVAICRTLGYRRQQQSWIKLSSLFENMIPKIDQLKARGVLLS